MLRGAYEVRVGERRVLSGRSARIVTASNDRTARIWDATTGTADQGHSQGTRTSVVRSAAFCPDGARVVTASR